MTNGSQFNQLKIHSQYSICEGAIKIDDLAEFCKKQKIKSIGLCDSYNLCGALEFAEKISKNGTQPIIGSQINIEINGFVGKLPLIAKNENGYKNLVELSSKSYLLNKNSEIESYVSFADLLKFNKDLFLFSGTHNDLIGKLFKQNKLKIIENFLIELRDIFEDRFYIEIQRHKDPADQNFESFVLSLSGKLNIPLIATQEVFYLNKDMYEAHDALICIGEKNYINDENRKRYSQEHYLKSDEELTNLFRDLPEALENNFQFPKRISLKPEKKKPNLPNIQAEKENNRKYLEEISKKGLEDRLTYILKNYKSQDEKTNIETKYKERLNHELKIIQDMDYSGYFLIVADYIKWSKSNNIPVGPGRGSGAGSLVAYCLDITNIDPIEFGLIFERFLNPDRISMPDFDIDFCEEKRDLVFEYLSKKYPGAVAHIITFGKLKARMVLRDVGRVMGLPYGYVDKICKMIPFEPSRPLTLQESINREPRLQKEIKDNYQIKKLVDLSLKLEGLNRNMATHAAGVVISKDNLSNQVPLYIDKTSNLLLPTTQFDMYSSENAGLVKFDLLGLKTLTIIDKTIKQLKDKDINININDINYNDPKVFKLLTSGETTGIFQLESAGMRDSLKEMKPTKLEDIVALVALYRPGPMSNISIYNQCKNNLRKPDFIHPLLEEILKPTYGIIIYQEQVMQIAQTLAGFTAGEADILRRAMGKKKRAELEKQRERFISGAVKNGIKKDLASFIFQKIEPFAEYGFNKSHAAAYATISYQTAFLKTYYKEEFFAASMSADINSMTKLREYVNELKKIKVEIINPSINKCFSEFKVIDKKIYYALAAIKNVGYEAISNIIKERSENGKYTSLSNFISRIDSKDINKLQLEGLVKGGAFDDLDKNRAKLYESIPSIINQVKVSNENKSSNQKNLFNENIAEDYSKTLFANIKKDQWTKNELLKKEFESLGFFLSDHPLNSFKEFMDQNEILDFDKFINSNNKEGKIAGTLLSLNEKKSSKGTNFAIAKFSDLSGDYELFIFSEILNLNRENLKDSNSFIITLIKDTSENGENLRRLTVKDIKTLDYYINSSYEKVLIEIDPNQNYAELNSLLKNNGNTEILLGFMKNDKFIEFKLNGSRKFDFNTYKTIKNKEYVKKIVI